MPGEGRGTVVISVRKGDESIYAEQADDTLTGQTSDGKLRVAFVCGSRIVGAIELTPDECEFLEGALARQRARIVAKRQG